MTLNCVIAIKFECFMFRVIENSVDHLGANEMNLSSTWVKNWCSSGTKKGQYNKGEKKDISHKIYDMQFN